jgi:3,4-dihydroxyphenylacetate 2,3-dioxygenase
MLHNMACDYQGDPELGFLIEAQATQDGIRTICHGGKRLNVEYGTFIPLRHANKFGAKVLFIAANQFSSLDENVLFGKLLLKAIKKSDRKMAFLASGSLSHASALCKIMLGGGLMSDTAMLFGLLGWKDYQGRGEVICDYFPSSGTGQCLVEFSVP